MSPVAICPDESTYDVVDRGFDTPCWIWKGAIVRGYGTFWHPGLRRRVQAHRVTYEAAKGPIPPNLMPDHLCTQRACVNPAHLELVTNAENQRRAVRHNRISDQQVAQIRFLAERGASKRLIMRMTGLGRPVVKAVVDGTYWR